MTNKDPGNNSRRGGSGQQGRPQNAGAGARSRAASGKDGDDRVVSEAKSELERIRQDSFGMSRFPDDLSIPVVIAVRLLQIGFIVFCVYILAGLILR